MIGMDQMSEATSHGHSWMVWSYWMDMNQRMAYTTWIWTTKI